MLGGRGRVKREHRGAREFGNGNSRSGVTCADGRESSSSMPRPVDYHVSTAELRSKIGGRSRIDGASVVLVGIAILTAPLAMWLMSLPVSWSS